MIDIKKLRTWMGLSQSAFAALAGIKQGTLSQIESKRNPQSEQRLAHIINVCTATVSFIKIGEKMHNL